MISCTVSSALCIIPCCCWVSSLIGYSGDTNRQSSRILMLICRSCLHSKHVNVKRVAICAILVQFYVVLWRNMRRHSPLYAFNVRELPLGSRWDQMQRKGAEEVCWQVDLDISALADEMDDNKAALVESLVVWVSVCGEPNVSRETRGPLRRIHYLCGGGGGGEGGESATTLTEETRQTWSRAGGL